MAKASDNPFPSILLVEQGAAPATPAAGQARLYRGSDNALKMVDDAGAVATVGAPAFSGCALTKSVAQAVSSGVETAVTWDGEAFDTDSYHSTASNTSRITIPTTGYYLFGASLSVAGMSDGKALAVYFRKNGAFLAGGSWSRAYAAGPGDLGITGGALLNFTAGDYLEAMIYHTEGISRDVDTSANGATFWIEKRG